jgi:hypothetical protein
MTYREILEYQARTMNDMLCYQWIGFRSDREAHRQGLQQLRAMLASPKRS